MTSSALLYFIFCFFQDYLLGMYSRSKLIAACFFISLFIYFFFSSLSGICVRRIRGFPFPPSLYRLLFSARPLGELPDDFPDYEDNHADDQNEQDDAEDIRGKELAEREIFIVNYFQV